MRARLLRHGLTAVLALGALTLAEHPALAVPGDTGRVSVAVDGTSGNANSAPFAPNGHAVAVSADGEFVVFDSSATNLVPGDTNGVIDVFVHDRYGGAISRASVASDGTQGNGWSEHADVSADGRYVAFASNATNLVLGDTNGVRDVFLRDRTLGTTVRVSVGLGGVEANEVSDQPAVSGDGRYIAFWSRASNLVTGDTNGQADAFVYDRLLGTTERVGVSSGGAQGGAGSSGTAISADGNIVAFHSNSTNLVTPDSNAGMLDIYVRDRAAATTTRVSVSSSSVQGNASSYWPHVSADGRYVAFTSDATNLVAGDTNNLADVFVHDRVTGETTRVSVSTAGSQGNARSPENDLAISPDGRFVAWDSTASTLVAGDTNGASDVFVHDRVAGTTARMSVASGGSQSNGPSVSTDLSEGASVVAFSSDASNLVPGDTTGRRDVFIRQATAPILVTKLGTGAGTVASSPAGIDCGSGCSTVYLVTQSVTLTATVAPGSRFDGFGGDPDCNDGTVSMAASRTCTATFSLLPPPAPPASGGAGPVPVDGEIPQPTTPTVTATRPSTATATTTQAASATAEGASPDAGRVASGTRPPESGGFGLFVFGGGSFDQLVEAACPGHRQTAVFFAVVSGSLDPLDPFVSFVPASAVVATNARWRDVFPNGELPPSTPLIGRCG